MSSTKEQFLKVLEGNQGIIFKVCHAYCKDTEDRKDLAQEVVIQLWNNFHKYDPRFKLSTWIYRIALNVAISFYRKTSTRLKHERRFAQHFLEIGPSQSGDTNNQIDQLHHFIGRLDKMNKALMILYLDGNSYEEIAQVLNLSVSNVGTKINRAKQKLKIQFQNIS